MSYRVIQMVLYAVSTAALALGLVLVAMSVIAPLPKPTISPPPKQATVAILAQGEERVGERRLSLNVVRPHWDKRLRGPARTPPPPPSATEVVREEAPRPVPIKFEGKLVGTLVDNDRTLQRAWLQWGTATPRVVSEGQKLDDLPGSPEIVSIATDEVTVQLGETVIVLKIERTYPGLNELPIEIEQ